MTDKDKQIYEAHALVAEFTRNHPEIRLTDIGRRFGISMPWLHRILRAHNVHRKVHSTLAERLRTNPELFVSDEVTQ